MQNAILMLHLIICMVLVGAVLMQRSEGGALGMGGGGTGGLISGRGAADLMVRITSWVGGAFFVTSLVLTVMAGAKPKDTIIRDPAERSGFHFSIPGFGKPAPKVEAPVLPPAAPSTPTVLAPPAGTGEQAPAPDQAVIRAGPLEAAPVGAIQTPTTAAGAAKSPVGAGRPAAQPKAPIGAAPSGGAAVGSQKAPATAPVPMIPLPTTPALEPESAQPSDPAPAPTRQKTGPDE